MNFNAVNRYIPLFVKTFLASKLRIASVRSTISTHSQDVEEFFKAIYKRGKLAGGEWNNKSPLGCLNYSVVDVSHCNIIERVPLRNFNCVLLESNIPWEVDYFIDTARVSFPGKFATFQADLIKEAVCNFLLRKTTLISCYVTCDYESSGFLEDTVVYSIT